MSSHPYLSDPHGNIERCFQCGVHVSRHHLPQTEVPENFNQVLTRERTRLIENAIKEIDDITHGIYLVLHKTNLEIEPHILVIFNPYVQQQQLKHFSTSYFVKL